MNNSNTAPFGSKMPIILGIFNHGNNSVGSQALINAAHLVTQLLEIQGGLFM